MHFTVCGTIRTEPAVGGADARAALSRAVSFPESGGRGVAVVVYPPLEPPPTQRAGRDQALQDGGQRRSDAVSAPTRPLRRDAGLRRWGADADVCAARCGLLGRTLKLEPLVRR